jgi:hypothetical protein
MDVIRATCEGTLCRQPAIGAEHATRDHPALGLVQGDSHPLSTEQRR